MGQDTHRWRGWRERGRKLVASDVGIVSHRGQRLTRDDAIFDRSTKMPRTCPSSPVTLPPFNTPNECVTKESDSSIFPVRSQIRYKRRLGGKGGNDVYDLRSSAVARVLSLLSRVKVIHSLYRGRKKKGDAAVSEKCELLRRN